MPVTRSMSSLLVSRLTFAPGWPCGTDTAPRADGCVHLRDAGQLAVLAAHDHRLTVRHARRGRVVGMDDDLGGLTEKVQLRVEPAHLPARHEHQRRRLPQRVQAGRRAAEGRAASRPSARRGGPPTARAARDRPRPSRSRRARRRGTGRRSSILREHRVVGGVRRCRRARGRGVDRARPAPTTSNGGRPRGRRPAAVCCAETRGLRKSHSVTSARSS